MILSTSEYVSIERNSLVSVERKPGEQSDEGWIFRNFQLVSFGEEITGGEEVKVGTTRRELERQGGWELEKAEVNAK